MSDEERQDGDARGTAGELEAESGHERRQRLRDERIRKWRKETRHPRGGDVDERVLTAVPRRFAP